MAELIAHPLLEVARIAHRPEPRAQIREPAEEGFPDAELEERLRRLERIAEEFPPVKNARGARPDKEVVAEQLGPEILDLLRLREEAMPADVEVESLVARGARDAADVLRIALQHGDGDSGFGEKVGGGEPGGARPDDGDVGGGIQGAEAIGTRERREKFHAPGHPPRSGGVPPPA